MLDRLRRHWPLKLLSLVLAFLLWVAVTGGDHIVQDYEVPIELELPEALTLVGPAPTSARVRLRATERALRRMDPLRHEMQLRVDLRDAAPGERTVPLTEDHLVGAPAGAEAARIVPDRIAIELDLKGRRELPVVPTIVSDPPRGYAFYGATASPAVLTVEGPQSKVDAMTRLRTDPILLSGHREPFSIRVAAVPESPDVRVASGGVVEVRVVVDAAPTKRTFTSIPVVLAGQTHPATVSPPEVDVVLAGPPALLGRLRRDQIRVVADVGGLEPRPEPYRLEPRVEFLELSADDLARLTVASVSRRAIQVRVVPGRSGS